MASSFRRSFDQLVADSAAGPPATTTATPTTLPALPALRIGVKQRFSRAAASAATLSPVARRRLRVGAVPSPKTMPSRALSRTVVPSSGPPRALRARPLQPPPGTALPRALARRSHRAPPPPVPLAARHFGEAHLEAFLTKGIGPPLGQAVVGRPSTVTGGVVSVVRGRRKAGREVRRGLVAVAVGILERTATAFGSCDAFEKTRLVGLELTKEEAAAVIQDHLRALGMADLVRVKWCDDMISGGRVNECGHMHDLSKRRLTLYVSSLKPWLKSQLVEFLHHELGTHALRASNEWGQRWGGVARNSYVNTRTRYY